MVLGKLSLRGRRIIWIIVGQGSTSLAVGAGGAVLTFYLSSIIFSHLSPSLWKTVRYRLKYCLKEPLNSKRPTNQPFTYFEGSTQHRLNYLINDKDTRQKEITSQTD